MSRYTLLALAVLVVPAGCATYRGPYAPVQTTSADPVPTDSPRGAVRLGTLGLTHLTGTHQRAVHLRMGMANRSHRPWTIRQAEQRLELSTGEPIYATTPSGGPVPVVEVPPFTTTLLDLFFPLPARFQDAREMEAFDAVWTIHLDDVAFTDRRAFAGFPTDDFDATEPAAADPFNTPNAPGRVPSAGAP